VTAPVPLAPRWLVLGSTLSWRAPAWISCLHLAGFGELSLAGRSFLEIEESHRGRVEAVGEGGRFEVRLDNGLHISSGVDKAMRRWQVAIVAGDRVTVEFPEGSPDRARIVFRHLQA